MRIAGQPQGRLSRERRRLVAALVAPLPLASAAAVLVAGCADSWRLALLAAGGAAAVAATRIRFSGRAALGLALVAALLALGGWGPGFDSRPVHRERLQLNRPHQTRPDHLQRRGERS